MNIPRVHVHFWPHPPLVCAQLWITPFAYNCTNQTYFNANWWDSTCSWAGDSFLRE